MLSGFQIRIGLMRTRIGIFFYLPIRILSYSRGEALKREHPALKNMTFLYLFFYFCGLFMQFWIRIQQLRLKRIYADPYPKPWFF
jgi:hypothetical protein